MERRDFLRGAALAGASTALPALASIREPETASRPSLGKIAMEEHFMVPVFMDYFAETYPNISADIAKLAPGALMDFGDRRLAIMDENRVDFVVLSLAGPGVQVEKDAAIAERKAHAVNDFLATEIQKRPARYGGFAHLAMQNPSHAADELERCIRDLGFQGALINGQTNGEYLDLDKYSVFWERVAELEAPVYLHPANPVDHPATFSGHSELWGPVCSWAFETATHALRLVFAGIFERYPQSPTHSRARRRDPAFQPVAFRQPLVGLQSSRPHAFQSAFLLHPAKHCRYHLRHVLGSPSALLSRCHGRGERDGLSRHAGYKPKATGSDQWRLSRCTIN